MRNKKLIFVAFSVLIYLTSVALLFILIPANEPLVVAVKTVVPDTVIVEPIQLRESITFILGEDHNPRNPYYTEATDYYRLNKTDRTEYLVSTCRSLLEVRNYLEANPPSNHLPWGLINLVAHGSEWLGLNVPVIPGSKVSSAERIMEYVNSGEFKPVSDSFVDDSSTIFIHGCGIGKNRNLLISVAEAFGGKTKKPVVRASKLFEFYMSSRNNGRPIDCQRFMTQSLYFFYPTGNKPSDSIINQKLQSSYPDESINWLEALSRETPRFPGDIYHYSFKIPIAWVNKLKKTDKSPDLSSNAKKIKWLNLQPEITTTTSSFGMNVNQFNWSVFTISYSNSSGERLPAVWVKGSCTILCVLKPLVVKKDDGSEKLIPFTPSIHDTIYYATE